MEQVARAAPQAGIEPDCRWMALAQTPRVDDGFAGAAHARPRRLDLSSSLAATN